MHELSLLKAMVKRVEAVARANRVLKIESLTITVGEASSVVPDYLVKAYPAATAGTLLDGAKLILEYEPARARCLTCSTEFSFTKHKGICPHCQGLEWHILSGRDCAIKEMACETEADDDSSA